MNGRSGQMAIVIGLPENQMHIDFFISMPSEIGYSRILMWLILLHRVIDHIEDIEIE